MYTTIIFDFFGVIHADPFKNWLNKHQFKDPEPYLKLMAQLDLGKLSKAELYSQYAQLSGVSFDEIDRDLGDMPLIDERAPKLIKRLRQNYKLAMLSNTSHEEIEPVLKEYGYETLFDVVFISGDVGLIKPDPKVFEYVLDKLGSSPTDTIFIDDNSRNVEAASHLGIRGLVFTALADLEADLSKLGLEF